MLFQSVFVIAMLWLGLHPCLAEAQHNVLQSGYCAEYHPAPGEIDCVTADSLPAVDVQAEPIPEFCPQPLAGQPAQIRGRVAISVCVSNRGNVSQWVILQSDPSHIGYEDTVTNIICHWRFKPAMRHDTAVPSWRLLTFDFPISH
jgi:hypothetical protein